MTTEVLFAPDCPRVEGSKHLDLPRDVEWRRELYFGGVKDDPESDPFVHPAKMQMFIVKYCLEYFAATGDLPAGGRVLDPFGGTGTTALASTMGYSVTLCELEPGYLSFLHALRARWRKRREEGEWPDMPHLPIVLSGDCRQTLKGLADHSFDIVITSPPYANLQVGKEVTEFTGELARHKAQLREYGSGEADPRNFGRLSTFNFNFAMRAVYKELLRVLKPNGVFVSVTKDSMRASQRQHLNTEVIRYAQAEGFEFRGEWWKWDPPGGMLQAVGKSKGFDTVNDEDIIAFRSPK